MEGIGLIATALGIAFLFQLPVLLFTFLLLQFDINSYLITLVGVVLGTSLILAVIACSLSEDWDSSKAPTLQYTVSSSLVLAFLFILGFFFFIMLLQPNLPPDIREMSTNQRFLAGYTAGLGFVAIFVVFFYRGREFFKR
jgi:hypothetical protein